ncbi:MAG: TonB-dependent receptor [Pseudomonadota bacterium]|nr:TonB-dependent receptor [Pseudomonadota bacterium]
MSSALLAALMIPVAGAAFAQDATGETQESTPQQAATDIDTVVVTGSRIKRTEIEGPAPVIVITAADLERQGFTTVAEALNTLTQISGSVQNELTQNGFTPNASVIDLRGLGPGRSLVLINGRRAADYPLPYNGQSNIINLNSIPSAAVERIEVLSGGASAIYGSDAVSGVVNIILKTNYEGDEVKLRAGTTTRGGGDSGDIQWVGGKTGSNWSLTYAFEVLEREEIFASQRDFMDSYRDDPSVDPANATAVIGLRLRNRLIGTGLSSYVYPTGENGASICNRFSEFELQNNGACGYFGYPATQQIRNADSNASAYLYGTMNFTDTIEGFASLSLWKGDAKVASATQFWQPRLYYDTNFGSIMDGQRIFTPDEVGGLNAQQTTIDERSYDFAVGLRGTFADRFDWDATLSRSQYDVHSERPRFVTSKINNFFLGPQQGVDPFFNFYPVHTLNQDRYYNPISAADFQSLITTVVTDADSSSTQASFVVSGDLFELPAGSVGMAAVLEGARQEYTLTPDPRILPGADPSEAIYNLTGTGGGGERDRYAVGVEFSVPILDSLKAQLAGRYDKYDDVTAVDDATTYNFGLEWRPFDSVLLRGSYATSFRAPDMHYVFADSSGFFTTVFDEFQCRNAGLDVTTCGNTTTYNESVFGTRRGNPLLEEEEGKSLTVGFVWDIAEGLSVGVDYFRIELDDSVSDISSTYLLRNEANCRLGQDRDGSAVDPNSAACQFFLNQVDRVASGPNEGNISEIRLVPINQSFQSIDGFDATASYRFDTDRWGDYRFDLRYSHTLSQEFEEFPGDGVIEYRDDLQNFDFRSRVNWMAAWSKDDWNAAVYGYRWGSAPNWEETGRIAPYIIWNMSASKKITEKATIGVAVNNVFDKLAPEDDSFFSYPFFWRAYSPIGREVFAEFSYKFR